MGGAGGCSQGWAALVAPPQQRKEVMASVKLIYSDDDRPVVGFSLRSGCGNTVSAARSKSIRNQITLRINDEQAYIHLYASEAREIADALVKMADNMDSNP